MHTIPPIGPSAPIEEREIRSALIGLLSNQHGDDSRVLEEFRIERGASRIDVAVISDQLIGYEIKSDKDTFARFSNQIHAYNRVFDRVNLVCGASLAQYAAEVIPSWWGIVVASREPTGGIRLMVKRLAASNPKQDAFSLASLLWKEEAVAALESREAQAPKRASIHALWSCMANDLPLEAIRGLVTKTLVNRQRYSELAVKTM